MMKRQFLVFILAIPSIVFANCGSVTMKYEFEIEGVSFREAGAWVGGWSAAIISSGKDNPNICIPPCVTLVTKAIVDILNEKFSGQTISAETASAAIWPELRKRLACKKPT
jgi:hypothetical protein